MAKAFRTAAGGFGFRGNATEELMNAVPGDAAAVVEFDEDANGALVADIRTNYDLYSVTAGGLLQKSGVTQTPADGGGVVRRASQFMGGVRAKQDRGTTSNSYVDVPDMLFWLEPNSHYAFQFDGAYTAAGATTGVQLALNGPASPDFFAAGFEIGTSLTAYLSAFSGAYDAGVNGTGSAGATLLPFHVFGNISTGAAGGFLTLRGRSETAGNQVTVKRGSYGLLFKVG